jgi:cytochrome b561
MKYDRATRWLHAGIALTVVMQLTSSLLMAVPGPGRAPTEPGNALFELHRWSGITVVGLLLLHWLWQLGGHVASGWGHLFPWFSQARMRRLMEDLKALPGWLRNGFPDQRTETLPMAGAIHGLGLLVLSGMAATGGTLFFAMAPDGGMTPWVHTVAEVHSFIAGFMWAYLGGHAGIALLHQWRESPLITDMFNLVRK